MFMKINGDVKLRDVVDPLEPDVTLREFLEMFCEMDDNEEIYEKALEKWGHGLQLVKTIEELGELIQEVSKVLIDHETGEFVKVDKLAEEIADVEIMLDQIKRMTFNDVNIGDKVDVIKKEKLARLAEMVGLV